MKIEHRAQQFGAIEIRPQRFRHVQLRVGDLPQQEIADAHFTRSSDQQIGFGQLGRMQMAGDGLLVNHQMIQAAVNSGVVDDGVHRVHDFVPRAVIDGEIEPHAAIPGGQFLNCAKLVIHAGGKRFHAPARLQPDVVSLQLLKFVPQIKTEQSPQHIHFGARPFPVFGGKRIKREGLDAQSSRSSLLWRGRR